MRNEYWLAGLIGCFAMACGDARPVPAPTPESQGVGAAATTSPTGGKGDAFEEDSTEQWEEIRERCAPPAEDEPVVYSNDFSWGYTAEDMGIRFEEIYNSGKRLNNRAYWDEEREAFMLPGTASWGGDVELPQRLVENVTLHIEHALERGYAEFVFFPDMGHSHLFLPQEVWDEEYAGTPVSENSRRYEKMFNDPRLMIHYHTAEQLQMLDEEDHVLRDRHVAWRFHTRNPVGDNNYERRIELLTNYESKANTAHNLPGYKSWSAGFNLSASKDGCFPYENAAGEIQWYDLSLEDLPYLNTGGDDWGDL